MTLKKYIAILLLFKLQDGLAQTDSVYYGERDPQVKTKAKNKNERLQKIKENMLYGGNFGAWFGNTTFINLSPSIGYRVTDDLQIGIGVIYNYASVRYSNGAKFSQSLYGSHSFARYMLTEDLFAQVQYDKLSQPNYYSTNPKMERVWVDYFLVGGGYRVAIGDKSALITSIMYNLTPHNLSIYSNPYFQMGFIAGF